jgi:hypothetical protein
MTRSVLDTKNPTFDRVEVHEDGVPKVFSYAEFMRLELARRIRLILAGNPRFMLGEREIEKHKALALR